MAKRKREEFEAVLPQLPDDIIRRMLPLLPTKSAFRISLLSKSNQFEGAWCSGPEIDLDEGKPQANLDGGKHFTNVLKRFLKFRIENHHPDHSLDKFRVRMAMDDPIREDILEELLNSFAKERSIEELDLSCLTKPRRLSFKTVLNINSLTSLSLESVPIRADDVTPYYSSGILLPSLKTLSLKSISLQYLDMKFLYDLMWQRSSSLENLSVISCSFDKSQERGWFQIASRTLKTLMMKDCNFWTIRVNTCLALESFTMVSETPVKKTLSFFRCNNLKRIDVREKHLESFLVSSDIYFVDITVDAPNITSATYNSKDVRDKCMNGSCFHEENDYYRLVKDIEMRGLKFPCFAP